MMKILLSPAKSIQTEHKPEIATWSTGVFVDQAEQLATKLAKKKVGELAKMMHLSDALAQLNVQRYANWQKPLNPAEEILPCAFMFTGEVYKGLAIEEWSEEQLLRGQERIRILSGLYGLLKPLDLMYPYRLEMGTKWQISPAVKNLYAFWGNKIAAQLNKETTEDEVIINLASNEYFKAVDLKTLTRQVITPVFKEFKGGDYKIVMMYAKHARGAMARYIVEHNLQNPEELKGYDVDGYRFHEALSSATEWVFTR
jgi:uncharacterized protein